MAAPSVTVTTYDRGQMNVSFEPQMGPTSAAAVAGNTQLSSPNRVAANETLPATITLGQALNSAAAVNGQYNTDAVITIAGERPLPQQE